MGSREQNFYNRLAVPDGLRRGGAPRCRTSTWPREHRDAAAAVPFEFIDRTSLLGPPERIRDRLRAYAEAGVTTLTVASYAGVARASGSRRCAPSPRCSTQSGLGE